MTTTTPRSWPEWVVPWLHQTRDLGELPSCVLYPRIRDIVQLPTLMVAPSNVSIPFRAPQFIDVSYVFAPTDPSAATRINIPPGLEVVGHVPARTERTVMGADVPRSPLQFTARERIGMAVMNPRGVQRIGVGVDEVATVLAAEAMVAHMACMRVYRALIKHMGRRAV